MNIIDRILLVICSMGLAILSIIMMLFPLGRLSFLSVDNINNVLINMEGEHIYSAIGLAFLLASIRLIVLGIKDNKYRNKISYLVQTTDYGEINISSEAIIGLTESVSNKFSGVKNIQTTVNILEGQLYIDLKGEVSPEIDIVETTKELQTRVKGHVERCTGVNVNEIKVIISNVTRSVRNVR